VRVCCCCCFGGNLSYLLDGPQVEKKNTETNAGIRKLIQSLLPLIRLFDFSCPLTIFIFICLFTKFRLAYEGYAGGVLTVSRDQYEAINGFSNEFYPLLRTNHQQALKILPMN
jgi:hypothetical protein